MTTLDNIVGCSQPKKVEQRRQLILIDYLLAASIHGLRNVGRARSTFNLVFWIIAFTAAFGPMLYFVRGAILQYYAYPTQTNVDIRLDRNMTFPAVTVCSANPFRYDRMNVSLISYFYRLYPLNATFNQNNLNSLELPMIVDLINRNQIDKLWSLGFELSDLLLQCTYNGIDCSNMLTPSLSTIFGNCFTFNWQTSAKIFTLNDFGTTSVMKRGLSMTFYIPREMYFLTQSYDVGLTILLHDNKELPLPNENGLSLQPGSSHLITYRKTETTFLPSPYTKCISDVSLDMHALYKTTFFNDSASTAIVYSESVCLELCEQMYIFSQCSCIFPIPFLTRSVLTLDGYLVPANFCDPSTLQTQCSFVARRELYASEQLQTVWCTQCNAQCQHTNFIARLSAQAAPSDGDMTYWKTTLLDGNNTTRVLLPNDFAQRFDYYFNRNYLKVRVTCGSQYITEYQQEAKLTIIDTFSAVGGQTGL
ncbi:unnamed protein product [Rotaria sp. Silwood2]|nr:unnamed protein product [Rotaria sp. Silwood2]CAF4107557.1 unnamed protein product [Rotaria sp. Silwood2]